MQVSTFIKTGNNTVKICKDSTFRISGIRVMSQKTKIICGAGVLLVILIVTISVVVISTSDDSQTNAQSPDQANKQTMDCNEFDLKKISKMKETPKIIIIGKIHSPEILYTVCIYGVHATYKLRLVCLFPHFWRPFHCFQGGFFRKLCSYQ